jgi:hypothetical protein
VYGVACRADDARRYDVFVRHLAFLLASAAFLGACATSAPTPVASVPAVPTMAAPAPFFFDQPKPDAPFVRRWLLLGPFDTTNAAAVTPEFIDEAAASPLVGETSAGHAWTPIRIGARLVDFRSVLGGGENAAAYAFTYLHAAQDCDAVVWLGADNQSRVLLDGRVIHEIRTRAWYPPDSFGLAIHLTRGVHRLLARVENYGGAHRMWLRIASPSGGRAPDVRWSLAPDDPQTAANALADPSGFSEAELLALLPLDRELRIGFDTRADVARLAAGQGYEDVCPMWREVGGPEYGPHPGRRGVVGLHAAATDTPERAYWKVHVPAEMSILRLVASPEAWIDPGRTDSLLRVGVFDGKLHWLTDIPLGPDPKPSESGWFTYGHGLPASSEGRDVLVVLEAVVGGCEKWHYEGVWLDEIEIVPAR